jgi:CheY-like chemotaxis protein
MQPKILIIDDSKVSRETLKSLLPASKVEVFEATGGKEGLAIAAKERPNLILLDFFMPDLNGDVVLKTLQASPELSQIPVVMMSANKAEIQRMLPEFLDRFEFLDKPFEPGKLLQASHAAMKKGRQSEPVASVVAPSKAAAPMLTPVAQAEPVLEPIAVAAIPPTAIKAASISPSHASALKVEHLEARINQLYHTNQTLTVELATLKKQFAQLVTFVKSNQRSQQKVAAANRN